MSAEVEIDVIIELEFKFQASCSLGSNNLHVSFVKIIALQAITMGTR